MEIFRKKTDEENFKETIEILRSLKKIKAPDNFEYNLMVKINNHDYGDVSTEEKRVKYSWILPPAAALVFTSVILFFVLSEQPPEAENPLLSPPTLRSEYQSSDEFRRNPIEYVAKETAGSVEQIGIINNDVISRNISPTKKAKNYKVVLQPNDVVVKKKNDFPFNNAANVNLDNYIQGSENTNSSNSEAQLVGEREDYPVFDFDGFSVRKKVDRKTLDKYRNTMDSIKNARISKEKQR